MTELIGIAYPDEAAAGRSRQPCQRQRERVIDVKDVVLIRYDDDGRLYPIVGAWEVGFAAARDAIAGGLIGLILLGPLLGMAAGGAVAGRAAWKRGSEMGHLP